MYWKIAFLLAAVLVSNVAGFFRFGPGAGDSNLGRTDDGSRTRSLSVPFRFYGRSYSSVRVSGPGIYQWLMHCIESAHLIVAFASANLILLFL